MIERRPRPSDDIDENTSPKRHRGEPADSALVSDMTVDPAQESAPDSQIDVDTAIKYWSGTSADVTGMLGGYPHVSKADLQGSSNFLAKLRRSSTTYPPSQKLRRVADCGAGIGRITLGFLSKVSDVVDIVEPVAKFTARITEGEDFAEARARNGIGRVYNVGLEAWKPEFKTEDDKYDLIWNQWCLGQLPDERLVQYLKDSQDWIKPGAWIVVKENLANDPTGVDIYDDTDSSVTRTDEKFRALFERAGLKIVSTELQRGFPKELYPVRVYALRPTKG